MSLTENEVHQDINRSFIERKLSYIIFKRPTMVDDGAGGFRPGDPTEVSAQKVRIAGQPRQLTTVTPDGRQVRVDLDLVGMTDLDVQIGDHFVVDNWEYEVLNIQDQPRWRVIVEARREKGISNPSPITSAFDSGFDQGFE